MRFPARSAATCILVLASCAPPAALAAAGGPVSSRAPAVEVPGAELLADFVEIGTVRSREGALVELVNMSPLTLDVVIGPGSATLQPDDRLFAGVEPGDVPVKVTAREDSDTLLDGDLQVEPGRKYQLAFAYGVPRSREAEAVARHGEDETPATTAAPTEGPRDARREAVRSGANPTARKRVDIGRKRR